MNALDSHSDPAALDLVYGIGSTGLSVARLVAREGRRAVYADSRDRPPGLEELDRIDPRARIACGAQDESLLDGVTRIVVSPGIGDRDRLLTAARGRGIAIVSDIELFVERARAPFVAVTGSNGKSTVTTLIALMANAAGRKALAGANLGEPALDLLMQGVPDLYVLELSSFQLQRTRHLPARVAVLLNISADHLDWHRDEREYREAKYRILREADAVVVNRTDAEARGRVADGQTCRSFALNEPRRSNWGIVDSGGEPWLARGGKPLIACSRLKLVGTHNRENALAALTAGDLLGLDTDAMLGVLTSFGGLPHRMQFIRERDGVRFIDDSKATNVAAAVASVRSVDGRVLLIAGGQGKGGDFDAFADAIHDRLRAAVLIGEDAVAIELALDARVPVVRAASMSAAVTEAAARAERGDTVLLAPACASFDMFDHYRARGDAFRRAVAELGS